LQRELEDMSRYFPFVFGVNSMGVDCGFGIPLITSRVASFIPWIDSILYPNPGSVGQREPEIEEHFQGELVYYYSKFGLIFIHIL
jgi:hypothetical protein